MEKEPLSKIEALALKRLLIHRHSAIIYLLRAILASLFIGFGVIVAFKTGNFFYLEHSPFAYPAAAITFGVAIIMIYYGGGDLFTGDTFYYTYAALRKQMAWKDVGKLWVYSYVGNIIGAILFALLIYATGLFHDPSVNSFLVSVAKGKTLVPTFELFFRGVLCNWLVCLAFFLPYSVKGDGPKIAMMILFVFCFFISGYEHSIANLVTFSISIATQHPDAVTIAGIVHNIIPVTIGNLIGGTLFMASMYYYVNKPFMDDPE
ncbi:formate/nitrite transporter family protein [Viridibacillus arvi]|uniref:Transporter n=1 Tax=Viridibacillus arvi TaxID=263475 RepID=A0A0M0LKK1_9BACL|nr:formate/nitrite transporter family protein [Viridibacillus arvi]KOO51564.1 transporter [Viridibacillus arvi]